MFRGTWAVQQGILTPAQLRSSAWRRLRRDVYADAALEVTHDLYVRGVHLLLPRGAAFGGLTAAALWGAREVVVADTDVEVEHTPTGAEAPQTASADGD